MSQTYSREEVSKHNSAASLWIVIDSEVYNLTAFADLHPGGVHVLLDLAGKDATEEVSLI
jgi:cytochrome b involved in lipid metabolism